MPKAEAAKAEAVSLRVYIHCEGCKKKVKKIINSVSGVESITIDTDLGKVTVAGKVDPKELVKRLEKAGKVVEIWPNAQGKGGEGGGGGAGKVSPKKQEEEKEGKEAQGSKEPKQQAEVKEKKGGKGEGSGGEKDGGSKGSGENQGREGGKAGGNKAGEGGGKDSKDGGNRSESGGGESKGKGGGGGKGGEVSNGGGEGSSGGGASGGGGGGKKGAKKGGSPADGADEEWSPNLDDFDNSRVIANRSIFTTVPPSISGGYSLDSAEYATHMFSDENANNCTMM